MRIELQPHVGMAFLMLGLAGCSQAPATAPASTPDVPTVAVAMVTKASIASSTVITAEFQPFQEIDVMAKVAGFVRTMKVDLGDHVREGQVLAELEVPEMTDDISRATAVVEQGGAESAAARAEIGRVQAAHDIVHLSLTRIEEVSRKEPGLIPRQELDEARARDQVAEAQIASATSRLRVEEQKTRVALTDEAKLRTMRNYITITAPFTGTVTKRYANVGAMIQAGVSSQSQAMPLVRLSQIDTLRLSLPVPESLVATVRPGQPAEVRVKSMNRTFEGRVARSSEKVDQSTRTMVTEVDVRNPSGLIKPGMYAEVSLQDAKHDGVLAAPIGAIERTSTATRVYMVDPAGTIVIVPVQLGIENAKLVEIVTGVQEGDTLITGRRAGLKAGDKVKTKVVDSAP